MSSMDVYETGADWRKSRRSVSNGACVEVGHGQIAPAAAAIVVRDSVDPAGPVIAYTARTWQTFINETKADVFGWCR
jgi:Domain of unknown function (DUF397)